MNRALIARILVVLPLIFSALAVAGPDGQSDADRVDRILTRLQKRSDGLSDIRCKVRFVEQDRVNLSEKRKFGTIMFMITEPNPHFMIYFERSEVDGVLGKREWYLFDGRWLFEVLERIEQVTQREIVRPGDNKLDLFDLETAPFPLPFGQRKETILKNFDVELLPPAKDDPPRTDHLMCVPKAESKLYGKYDMLEFFVLQDVNLPSRIIVTKNEGLEVNTADFPDLSAKSINSGVSATDFAKPREWKKYELVVEEMAVDDGRSAP